VHVDQVGTEIAGTEGAVVILPERTRAMSDLIPPTSTMKMLERSLDLMAQRHQVLLGNVANEETPRFKAKDLEFQAVLASIGQPGAGVLPITRTAAPHPRHLLLPGQMDGTPPPVLKELPATSFGLDGNTVSIEKTMAAMHDNSTLYSAASQILSRKFQGLLAAIRG
jgi:flagellar basal-body rod protein FlgB